MTGASPKPARGTAKLERRQRRLDRSAKEDGAKKAVRKRDKRCRFPLCRCDRLGLRQEASHREHKGMGGDPDGHTSMSANMLLLCISRHQGSRVSIHKGTLRWLPLDAARGANGPVIWQVDTWALGGRDQTLGDGWLEVAREIKPGVLDALAGWQDQLLRELAWKFLP